MPLLKLTAFDFRIPHPWVSDMRVKLNSFLHRGYWFHGRRREQESMRLFARLIDRGDTIVEVGGHIGFISAYFAHLAGPEGLVVVLEPGANNLPYLKANLASVASAAGAAPITLIEKGAGPQNCAMTFYEDNLTGQNNSVVPGYAGLAGNSHESYVRTSVLAREIEVITLDRLAEELPPIDFVKIDVEGFELSVLLGMTGILGDCRPIVMVEVQADRREIFDLLRTHGYRLFNIHSEAIEQPDDMFENVFALHADAHAPLIELMRSC